jgi:hypothetical protein
MQLFANNASSRLVAGISNVSLSMQVSAGEGVKFPNPTGGDYFLVTLSKISSGIETATEIVKVTARATDVFTIVRAQEGTSALVFAEADFVQLRFTAGSISGMAYTHPTNHPASIITQDASNRFVTDAEKTAWNAKQATLVSGTNIKTVGGASLLGSGDIAVGGLGVVTVTTTTQTAVVGSHYVLTNVAATTLTLPASPASGDTVAVTVANALTTNLIARNAQTIMGLAEDMTLDNPFETVTLRFLNSTWRKI